MRIKTQRPNHSKILEVATRLSIIHGIDKTYVSMIAKEINCHHSMMYAYYDSIEDLRNKIIDKAMQDGIVEIIMDALLNKRLKKSQLSDDMLVKISAMFEKNIEE